MQRIDTHLHLWDATRFDYPWHQSGLFSELPDTYSLDDAMTEVSNEETAFVVVQAEVNHAHDPVEETAWVQKTVDEHPKGNQIAGFVAYADLSDPNLERTLERHARHSVFTGIRQEIWWKRPATRPDVLEDDMLENSAWCLNFAKLADVNASFDLTCWHTQLRSFASFLSDYPGIPVIVDHLGSPVLDDDHALEVWRDGINALAALPNTFMKISGLSQADPHWSVDCVRPLVDHVLDAFGAERCMLGSNFPVEKLTSSYETVWNAYQDLFAELTSAERSKLYFKTAKAAYRLLT